MLSLLAAFVAAEAVLPASVFHWVTDLGQGGFAALAAACAFGAAHVLRGSPRWGWRLLGVGVACWAAGTAVWDWYELGLHDEVPFPSAADIGYLGLPVFAVPALWLLTGRSTWLGRLRGILDGALLASSLLLAWYVVVLRTVFAAGSGDTLAQVVGLAYPCSDVLLAVMTVLALSRATGPARRGLFLLGLGLLGFVVADSAFALLNATGNYVTGVWCDDGWAAGFLIIAVAAVETRAAHLAAPSAEHSSREQSVGEQGAQASLSSTDTVLPFVCVLGGVATLVVDVVRGGALGMTELALGGTVLALAFARQWVLILDNRTLVATVRAREAQLHHQAFHDALTGLANRALFADRLQHAVSLHLHDGRPLALLYIDLDGFKPVNDTFGHATGDVVLRAAAERLRGRLRDSDTVARLGGDEFAVLLHADADRAASAAEDVLRALLAPIVIDHEGICLGASIGLVHTSDLEPDARTGAERMVHAGDLAMYSAKRAGGCRIVRYTRALEEPRPYAELLQEFSAAVAASSVVLVYQPIHDLTTGAQIGVEALARWTSSAGPVPPSEFIALAEESGLIVPLGARLLRQALRDVMTWSNHAAGADWFVSVNVSPLQVASLGWADDVAEALGETGADPAKLILELTETAALGDIAHAQLELGRVRRLGVRLALDDFGTGHSSLGWLHHLPVDVIKVDRAFVAGLPDNPASRRVVEVCVAVASVLGVPLVAEGVETPDQTAVVEALECRWAQGWRYGRPVPADHVIHPAQAPVPRAG